MSLFKANVPPSRVPTLTEVVEVVGDSVQAAVPVQPDATAAVLGPAPVDSDLLTQRVMADMQRQIDAILEVRLKETLAPVVARLTDALARDARAELTKVMKDVVSRAVANEMSRTSSRD